MTIKIQTKKTVIPVEIGKLNFEFDVSDDSVVEFRKNAKQLYKELEVIGEVNDEEKALELSKETLQKGFDLFLGDGAFKEIYKQTPSVVFLMDYITKLSEGIEEELRSLGFSDTKEEKVKKYLKNKK